MLLYIPVNQARNKIEPLLLSHFGSLQRPLGNTVNRVHTRMPGVLRVSLETGQFRLRGIPLLTRALSPLPTRALIFSNAARSRCQLISSANTSRISASLGSVTMRVRRLSSAGLTSGIAGPPVSGDVYS